MTSDPVLDVRRFTVEEYERMGEVGIFDPAERVELLDGKIVPMSPIGPKHAGVVDAIATLSIVRLFGRATVRQQNPLRLLPRSEPQPDVVIARFRRDFYRGAHPTAEDTLLVIEVADSSLRTDRMIKIPIYARKGIVEVWIVDLASEVVHVHTDPVDGTYRTVHAVHGDEPLSPRLLPDLTLTPRELFDD